MSRVHFTWAKSLPLRGTTSVVCHRPVSKAALSFPLGANAVSVRIGERRWNSDVAQINLNNVPEAANLNSQCISHLGNFSC